MELKRIDRERYSSFIKRHFAGNNILLEEEQANYIYDINKGITCIIQYLCNKLYSTNLKNKNNGVIDNLLNEILPENEIAYYNYRALLTKLNYDILKAVASEEQVEKPFAQAFLRKYELGSASSVKSAIKNLESKGLLVNNNGWRVADWYFSLWLKKQM